MMHVYPFDPKCMYARIYIITVSSHKRHEVSVTGRSNLFDSLFKLASKPTLLGLLWENHRIPLTKGR